MKAYFSDRMADAMKEYPTGMPVERNYLEFLCACFVPHAETQIINLQSEIKKLLSLIDPCLSLLVLLQCYNI